MSLVRRNQPGALMRTGGAMRSAWNLGKLVAKGINNFRNTRVRKTIPYNKGRRNAKPKTELKAYDTATGNQTFSAAATFQILNAMQTGVDLFNRIGRKIYMKSVHIRGFIQPVAGPQAADLLRIIVLYDSQTNAGVPAGSDVLKDSTIAAVTSGLSEINLANRERFLILRDLQIHIPAYAAVTTGAYGAPNPVDNFNINMFIPLRGLEAVFNANNASTAADLGSGALYVMLICQNNNAHIFSYNSRLRYYD